MTDTPRPGPDLHFRYVGPDEYPPQMVPLPASDDVGQGDAPDTFDDRLADIARLIDTLADEATDVRRAAHRAIVVRLLTALAADALRRIADQLERVDT